LDDVAQELIEKDSSYQEPEQAVDESALSSKEQVLISAIKESENLIVAYSGGVDSSLLAFYARKILKDRAKIVIAVSPSLANSELEAARAQAVKFNWDLVEISTDEVDKAEYQRNDEMRCYFCKSTLFTTLTQIAERENIKSIAYGANMDDLKDFRPGHKAARESNVLSPLQTAKLGKDEIRILARRANLPSWNRPQAACLSSRFPTFQPVTITSLSQVEKAEDYLRTLGYKQIRVRHHDVLARIEVDKSELSRLLQDTENYSKIVAEFKCLGYKHITVDLEGYKQGSANNLK
jgi:pyridinium-3,5-biscarboxylic acid mononucleotide sulfurtransferase